MPLIGYHASQEQFSPSALLAYVQAAQAAGFGAAMTADHFHPWSERQGHSGFTWAWLGAALQATSLPFGSLAIPGGWRYHPALLAQAIATLGEMFPKRLAWIFAGSGQALNERITAQDWPSKELRRARLKEGVEIMRALWAGETVTREDGLIPIRDAQLWDRPVHPPKLCIAALTPETAAFAAPWADGLITVNQPEAQLRAILEAFRAHGGAGKPTFLQVHLAWAETDAEALREAHDQWRTNIFPTELSQALDHPRLYDMAAEKFTPEDMRGHMTISADPGAHRKQLRAYLDLGFDHLFLHQVGRDQARFIECFGRDVLPGLR